MSRRQAAQIKLVVRGSSMGQTLVEFFFFLLLFSPKRKLSVSDLGKASKEVEDKVYAPCSQVISDDALSCFILSVHGLHMVKNIPHRKLAASSFTYGHSRTICVVLESIPGKHQLTDTSHRVLNVVTSCLHHTLCLLEPFLAMLVSLQYWDRFYLWWDVMRGCRDNI